MDTLTLYDLRAVAASLNLAVQVCHASDFGQEARAFTLHGPENDVRKLAAMMVSATGQFLQVGRFELVENGPCHGLCSVSLVMSPDVLGVPRREDPDRAELERVAFLLAGMPTQGCCRALVSALDAARRALGLPAPWPPERS